MVTLRFFQRKRFLVIHRLLVVVQESLMTLGRLFFLPLSSCVPSVASGKAERGGAKGGLNKGTLWLFRPPLTPPNLGGEIITFEAVFSDWRLSSRGLSSETLAEENLW